MKNNIFIRKKKTMLLLIVIFLCFPLFVKAETTQFEVCISSNTYTIIYDSSVATEVSKEKIDQTAINNGHVKYPSDSISESEKLKYKFTSIGPLRVSCSTDDEGNISQCPTKSQQQKYIINDGKDNIAKNYMIDADSNISYTFNESNGTFDYEIKDKYNGDLYIRYVSDFNNINSDEKNASDLSGQMISASNGKFVLRNVPAGQTVYIEFYLKKSGDCSGSFLTYIYINTPYTDGILIRNPAINNKRNYGCDKVDKYKNGRDGNPQFNSNPSFGKYVENYIWECYQSEIYYSQKKDITKEIIQEKLTEVKAILSKAIASGDSTIESDTFSNNGSFIGGTYKEHCTEPLNLEGTIYSKQGTYWTMTCYAKYSAVGDTPKLVKAGEGFSYESKFTINRECTITWNNKTVKKKDKCRYTTTQNCTWNTKSGQGSDPSNCGPNDNFDDCIIDCDNGKYTQECINKCYSTVYGNDRNLTELDKFSYSPEKGNTKFVATIESNESISLYNQPLTGSCTTNLGNAGGYFNYKGHSWCVSKYCNTNAAAGSTATITTKCDNCPGCSDDPETEYQNAIKKVKTELEGLQRLAEEKIQVGNYNANIIDSYLLTKRNYAYVFKTNVAEDYFPVVRESYQLNKTTTRGSSTVTIGSEGDKVTFSSTTNAGATIKISLPDSYVQKVTSTVAYSGTKNKYNVDAYNNRFTKVERFSALNYYPRNNKYYTNVWSGNINVNVGDKVTLLGLNEGSTRNIKISSNRVGNFADFGGFSSDILCYYGVYNNFYCKDPKDCPNDPDDPDKPDNPDPTGIQWIFRPINLEDVFPNDRNPRWNWTGTLNNGESTGAAKYSKENVLKYDIDPINLTKDIESKGNSIYNDSSEIDYEFVLTRENLNHIRAYNKSVSDYNGDGKRNYGDFNMSCYKDAKGKEVCTSRFLDNVNDNSSMGDNYYITYNVGDFTIGNRKNIAGCNNAKNGSQCDD